MEVNSMDTLKGKASTRAKNKYNAANYDNLRVVVPKGRKTAIDAYAKAQGESVNGLINTLLRKAMGMSEEAWRQTDDNAGGA